MSLDKKTKAVLKKRLLEEKLQLEKELRRFANPVKQGDFKTRFEEIGKANDENALEVENYADNLALEKSLEKQLQTVNHALEKIKKNTYGRCEKCRKNIDSARLEAYPAADRCLGCQ